MKNLTLRVPSCGLYAISDYSVRETLRAQGFAVKGLGGEMHKGYHAFVRITSPREERETIVTPRGRKVCKVKRWNERFTRSALCLAIAKGLNVSPRLARVALAKAIESAKGLNPYAKATGDHFAAKSNKDIYNQVGGSGHSAHSESQPSKAGRSGI